MINKKSIRFYNDHKVRAIWSEEENKWYFSATDIIGAINDEQDYVKAGNYWRWLKKKLASLGIQPVSATHDFKFQAPDGKMRKSDVLDFEGVEMVAKNFPNTRATAFLDWFTFSDNSIDGQSRKKAYTLFESGILDDMQAGTIQSLQQIHAYLFGGLYDFAGQIRTKTIWKDGTLFCRAEYLRYNLDQIEQMPQTTFDEIVDKYIEMNIAHPFMEGNGRSTRLWLDLIFKSSIKQCVDWSQIDKKAYLQAMRHSTTDSAMIRELLRSAMTDQINDREMFMKGIDYSYYYEQEE